MDIKYFAKIFPKLRTDTIPQIQEAQRTPSRIKKKKKKKKFNQDISYVNCYKPKM